MDEMKHNVEFQERVAERMISGIATVIVITFAVVAVGTAAIPAILAHLFDWRWIAAYPCIFAVCSLWARRKKH